MRTLAIKPMQTVFIKTLGCKVNTFDSTALHKQFQDKGYTVTNDPNQADIIVVNTCSVTLTAEKEARYLLRRYGRETPEALKVVTGCYAQTASTLIAEVPEVDLVIPNNIKDKLIDYIEQQQSGALGDSKLPPEVSAENTKKELQFKTAHTFFSTPVVERVRAFLKIQDGCDGFCAYCQIPYARGSSRSVPPEKVVQAAQEIIASGIKEITLTGIHIGDYGQETFAGAATTKRSPIVDVLRQLFALPGLERLRISSLEPSEVSPELIAILAENRDTFCDHFHLPLQAGSDRILKLMGRAYDSTQYLQTIEALRQAFPQAQFTADVIPGFPGESEEDFAETLAFIRRCGLSSLHVFPYSKRPHTRALRFPGHLAPEVIKERARILRELSQELARSYRQHWVGSTQRVLWEQWDEKSRRFYGKSKNYLQIASAVDAPLKVGDISAVQLKGFIGADVLLGI